MKTLRVLHFGLFSWLISVLLVPSSCMRINPERIAARLRIEQEIEMDKSLNRNRRQLVTPKEISISITAPLFSSRLFEYGIDVGDQEVPKSLDVGKKVTLKNPIRFYGTPYSTIFILSNGGIGFESTARSYRANILPSNLKLIAPFWNRNDLRNGGNVYYREVTSGRALERGQSEIRYQYDTVVKVKSCILVTWEKMQPLGASPLPSDNTNTFQMALFITDNITFANFIYKNVGWTQGAEAGFSKGEDNEYYALPTSGTGNIMYLEEYGNTGIPGEWMFLIGDRRIERCKLGIKGDTCDEECSSGEWGADCARCCHCAGGKCNPVTGECPAGGCAQCWLSPPTCQTKDDQCALQIQNSCVHNAISFTDFDRCGEPIRRCQCLSGYEGDGHNQCNDIDECVRKDICHENAICTNTPGRYFCQCIEGFTGDGVTTCTATFLFPYQGHQALPKGKNAKLVLYLKNPMVIFGQFRDQLTVSAHGIISIDDFSKIKVGEKLDSLDMHGVAPFFAPIDLRKGGQIFAEETDDEEVLKRVTHIIKDNYNDEPILIHNVIIVTFVNVSNGISKHAQNTFQTLLIGASNKQRENLTYALMLYKDLLWSDGAEAGIMTLDESNAVILPGSGTGGIEQLSQLSNIQSPGQWLYRIDSDIVLPCSQSNLQPPYCDSDTPALISQHIPSVNRHNIKEVPPTSTETPLATTLVKSKANKELDTSNIIEIGGPRIIHPLFIENSHHSIKTETTRTTTVFTTKAPYSTTRKRPLFAPLPATPHLPLVSIDSRDIDDLLPDVFDITLPEAPEVYPVRPKTTHVSSTSAPETSQPRDSLIEAKNYTTVPLPAVNTTQIDKKDMSIAAFDRKHEIKENLLPDAFDITFPAFIPDVPQVYSSKPKTSQASSIPIFVTSPLPVQTTSNTTVPTIPKDLLTTTTILQSSTSRPLYIFTTPLKKKLMPTKPKLVTAPSHTSITTMRSPFDSHGGMRVETSTSNLAVIIPTAIISIWLLLLAVIALFCFCRKRRAERQFREIYFPTHQIRPLSMGYTRKNNKHLDGSYEDHLEKAARLSSELSSYNQNARMSLYGSYWNLSNCISNGHSSSNRRSPFAQFNNQQRYTYSGHY